MFLQTRSSAKGGEIAKRKEERKGIRTTLLETLYELLRSVYRFTSLRLMRLDLDPLEANLLLPPLQNNHLIPNLRHSPLLPSRHRLPRRPPLRRRLMQRLQELNDRFRNPSSNLEEPRVPTKMSPRQRCGEDQVRVDGCGGEGNSVAVDDGVVEGGNGEEGDGSVLDYVRGGGGAVVVGGGTLHITRR